MTTRRCGGSSEAAAAAAGREAGDVAPSLEKLPRELLVLMIADHMHEASDVRQLSLTSRSFFCLIRSPDLVAAWLWKRWGKKAPFMAMENDDVAVLRQLIEIQHADVDAFVDGCGLLHHASCEGKLEIVTFLLSVPGIQVNRQKSYDGWTALHLSSRNGHVAIVHELLQHPAVVVTIKSKSGITALYVACREDKPQVVAELLRHPGIDVNQTCGPWTPLHVACLHSHARVVRELLKHPDIRVNQKEVESNGKKGRSALQLCLLDRDNNASVATLKELLKHPGLDLGDMEAALRHAQADITLSRSAQAIADAL